MYMNIHVLKTWCVYLKLHISSNNLELGKSAKIRTPAESTKADSGKFRTLSLSKDCGCKGREAGPPPSLMRSAASCQEPSEQSIIFLHWDATGRKGAGLFSGVLQHWLISYVFWQNYLSSWLEMGLNHYKLFSYDTYQVSQKKCFYYLTSFILSVFLANLTETTRLSNHYSETSADSCSNLEKELVCQLWNNVDF